MKFGLLTSVALYGFATAGRHSSEPKGHEFRPARPWDRRSPCPGLNVLANHGWLPRSGKDIDLEDVRSATEGAFNFFHGMFDTAVEPVFTYNLSSTKNFTSTFNLDDLAGPAAHGTVEFDGSLSRNDFFFGDALHFDPKVWHTVSAHLGLDHVGKTHKDKFVTIETAANARVARVKAAMKANPDFNSSGIQAMGSPGTTALYLATLWDDDAKAAPKSWIKAFFEDERIPYKEGFKTPPNVKTSDFFTSIFSAVSAVSV